MNLEHLQKIAEGATPGVWRWAFKDTQSGRPYPIDYLYTGKHQIFSIPSINATMENKIHIATFNPELVLAMIAEIRAHREEAQLNWRRRNFPGLEVQYLHTCLEVNDAKEKLDKLLEEMG